MKKIVTILISVMLIMMSVTYISVSAKNLDFGSNEITPFYLYTYKATSDLSVSGNNVQCDSMLMGYPDATKVNATQYLQKKNSTDWETVYNGTWSSSSNGNYLVMTNSKSNLSSGTYRLKTIFVVFSGNEYEMITAYSSEKTI